MLDESILYLSLYLKANRQTYYDLLTEVRSHGTWKTWLEFFLIGITQSSKQAMQTAQKINDLFKVDRDTISHLRRARFSCEQALEYMKRLPQVTVPLIAKDLKISQPTARSALNHLTDLGVLEEVSGHKRDKFYIYRKYLDILEDGAEPFATI